MEILSTKDAPVFIANLQVTSGRFGVILLSSKNNDKFDTFTVKEFVTKIEFLTGCTKSVNQQDTAKLLLGRVKELNNPSNLPSSGFKQRCMRAIAYVRFFFWNALSSTAQKIRSIDKKIRSIDSYLEAARCLRDDTDEQKLKAFRLFQYASNNGYAPAQRELGYYFERGFGVEKNANKAFFWYNKAVQQEDAKAYYRLGFSYIKGQAVTRNCKKAGELFEKAIALGYDKDKSAKALVLVESFSKLENGHRQLEKQIFG